MKASTETLSPTRVKLTVEVPFADLESAVQQAYRKLGRQVKVAGFRPGKVPPRVLDQRIGRGPILDEAVNEALPHFYSEAVRENSVAVVGQPEVDIASFGDGEPLVFTAEVDVRPQITLPRYDGIAVTVDDAVVSDQQVDEHADALRDRFAVLAGVERATQAGDYITLDLSATVDGEPLPEAEATGLSYEVGSGRLIPGIDEAVLGANAGETRTFQTDLVSGDMAGSAAEVAVVVRAVKEKQLPDLDDDFAESASEFETLAELRADLRARLEIRGRMEQAGQARDRVLEALLAQVEVPLPESVLEAEVQGRLHKLGHELEQMGATLETYLESRQQTPEQLHEELKARSAEAVKAQFVLDAVALKEELQVTEAELTEHIVRQAQRAGVSPEVYARQVSESGQAPALVQEVAQGKALGLILQQATVIDSSGRLVDLASITGPAAGGAVEADEPVDGESDPPASGEPATGVASSEAEPPGPVGETGAGAEAEQHGAAAGSVD